MGLKLGLNRARRTIRRSRLRVEELEERRVLSGVNDDFPDSQNVPTALIDLTDRTQFNVFAALNASNDIDVFRVRVPSTGAQSIRLVDFDQFNEVDYKLEIFDLHGTQIAASDNTGGSDSPALAFDRFLLPPPAGDAVPFREFFVQVSSIGTSTFISLPRTYTVQFASYLDDQPSSFNAPNLGTVVVGSGTVTQSGNIEVIGDSDTFRFRVSAALAGETGLAISVVADPTTRAFDPNVIVRDSNGVVVAHNDNRSSTSLEARVTLLVRPGEEYTVTTTASPFTIPSGITGRYQVQLTPFSDSAGDTTERSVEMPMNPNGTGSISGELGDGADRDAIRFTLPSDGIFRLLATTRERSGTPRVALTRLDGSPVGTRIDDGIIRFEGRAGDRFLAVVSSRDDVPLSFQLRVAPLNIDDNNTAATATLIPGSFTNLTDGSNRQQLTFSSSIGVAGDVDFLRLISPINGSITLSATSPVAGLQPQLEITNSNGAVVGSGTGPLTFSVTEGSAFIVRVAGTGRFQGNYTLTATTVPERIPDTIAGAVNVAFNNGEVLVQEAIEFSSDGDIFRVVAPASGEYVIRMSGRGINSFVDSTLTVFDANGQILVPATNDPLSRSALIRVTLNRGDIFFVRASAELGSIGDYTLTISPPDAVPNTFAGALELTFANNRIEHRNTIEIDDAGDVFRIVPTTTGNYAFQLDGDTVTTPTLSDPFLAVFNADGVLLDDDDDDGPGLNSFLSLQLEAGRTYFVRARGFRTQTGNYQLSIALNPPDTIGDTIGTALPVDFPTNGFTFTGTIEAGDSGDLLRVVAPESRFYRVSLNGTGLTRLTDPFLEVLQIGTGGGLIVRSSDDDSGDGLNSTLLFAFRAGETYFLRARGFGSAIGDYTLSVEAQPTDLIGNDIATAADLGTFSAGGLTVVNLLEPGDTGDLFRIVAPVSGDFVFRLMGDPNRLPMLSDPVLELLDATGSRLAVNDDIDFSSNNLDSRFTFLLVAGTTYFVRAGGFSGLTGNYRLSINPVVDRVGNTLATAQSLTFTNNEIVHVNTLESQDAGDLFQIVAPSDGNFELRLSRPQNLAPTLVNPVIELLDEQGTRLERLDGFGSDPVLTTFLASGQTYFVRVTDAFNSSGNYLLSVVLSDDQIGDSIQTAAPLNFINGSITHINTIDAPLDLDVFRIVAPNSGVFRINLDGDPPTSSPDRLSDPVLSLLDVNGQEIATNDDFNGLNSQLEVFLEEGQTYFLRARGFGNSRGQYRLAVRQLVVDPNRNGNLQQLQLDSTGSTSVRGTISDSTPFVRYRFVADFSGELLIEQQANSLTLSTLDSVVRILDANLSFLDSNDDGGEGVNSELTFRVTQGMEYVIEAGRFGTSVGDFNLRLSRLVDAENADNPETAIPVTLATDSPITTLTGRIDHAGDVEWYRFTATNTGPVEILQSATGVDSSLDSFLQVSISRTISFSGLYEVGDLISVQITAATGQVQTLNYTVTTSSRTDMARDFARSWNASTLEEFQAYTAIANGESVLLVPIESGFDPLITVATTETNGAPSDGQVVRISPRAREGTERLIENDDSNNSLDSTLVFRATQGTTYYVRAGAFSSSRGNYSLAIRSIADDIGDTVADGDRRDLTGFTGSQVNGTLQVLDDVDVFSFIATESGGITLRVRPTGNSLIAPLLSRLDTTGAIINTGIVGDQSISELAVVVEAGERVFLQVARGDVLEGFLTPANSGYTIDAPVPNADLVSERFDRATILNLGTNAPVYASFIGAIEVASDQDVYQFVSPITGDLQVRMEATDDSLLDSLLELFDSQQRLIIRTDDTPSQNSLDADTTISVTAGETYFLRASVPSGNLANTRTGGYRLVFQQGRTLPLLTAAENTSTRLVTDPMGETSSSGSLELPGEVEGFTYTANRSGAFRLRVTPTAGSTLDPVLSVYRVNTTGERFVLEATNNDGAGLLRTSELTLHLAFGQTYLFLVDSVLTQASRRVGGFDLDVEVVSLRANDETSVPTGSIPLTVAPDGSASFIGFVDFFGATTFDRDTFRYVPTITGTVEVVMSAINGTRTVEPFLVFTRDPNNINTVPNNSTFDAATQTRRFQMDVIEGVPIFIETAGRGVFGSYRVDVTPLSIGEIVANAIPVQLNNRLLRNVLSTLTIAEPSDTFRLVAPQDGTLNLQFGPLLSSGRLSSPSLRVRIGDRTFEGVDLAFDSSRRSVSVPVSAGDAVMVTVSGLPTTTEQYSLLFSYAETINLAAENPSFSREIDFDLPRNLERFAINAATDGVLSAIIEPIGEASDTDLSLRLLDVNRNLLAVPSPDVTERGIRLQLPIFGGETRFLELQLPPGEAGDLRVRFLFTPGQEVAVVSNNGSVVRRNVIVPFEPINDFFNPLIDRVAERGEALIGQEPVKTVTNLIPLEGTTQVQSFEATMSGISTLNVSSRTGLQVGVWDSQNQLLASGTNVNSLSFATTARETYFIRVSSPDDAAPLNGTYSLFLRTDPPRPVIQIPAGVTTPMPLNPPVIATAGGQSGITFVPPSSGTVTLQFGAGVNANLNLSVTGAVSGVQFNPLTNTATFRVDGFGSSFTTLFQSDTPGKFDGSLLFVPDADGGGTDPGDGDGDGDDPGGNGPGGNGPGGPGNNPPPGGNANQPGTLALFTPNPFSTQNGEEGLSTVVTADASNLQLLVVTLVVGFEGDSEFPSDGELSEDAIGPEVDEAIEQRLQNQRSERRSLSTQFEQFLARFLNGTSPEQENLRKFLRSPEGQEAIAGTKSLLLQIDQLRAQFSGVDAVVNRLMAWLQPTTPAGEQPQTPPMKPNVVDDFFTPEPMKQSTLTVAPTGELKTTMVMSEAIPLEANRYRGPMALTAIFLGILALRSNPENFRRWMSRPVKPGERKKKFEREV
jgi:flagellar basal body rod protein FlgF